MTKSLPTGVVTFLLTDIEGSGGRLWDEQHDDMAKALARYEGLVEEVIEHHGGALVEVARRRRLDDVGVLEGDRRLRGCRRASNGASGSEV